MKRSVVLAGALAQKPDRGGHTWVFLQYLLGFRQLGWNVLFLDHATGVDVRPGELPAGVASVAAMLCRAGFACSYGFVHRNGVIGLTREEILDRVAGASAFINVMGFFRDEEILAAARRRVFLDIDPGFGQMWQSLGLHDSFRGHDAFVTVGANVGASTCAVPTCDRPWIPSRPPVVLSQWPMSRETPEAATTTVATWRGAYGPVEYNGTTYGLRAHEFRRFARLPAATHGRFEIALDIHSEETRDLEMLETNGWVRADPVCVAGDPWRYRQYIQNSAAEFSVAKNMYVQSRCGWFSDRTACYLASGKPVLVQDTGLQNLYPTGDGLLTFSTFDEAVAGVNDISRDYTKHARAARAVAETYFDSDKVLLDLSDRLNLS